MLVTSFLEQPVRGFLDQVAARTPAPGGGVAAAVTGAMAAGLVAMAARFSAHPDARGQRPGGPGRQAALMAVQLADMDARAYAAVLDAVASAGPTGSAGSGRGRPCRARPLVPLEIAGIGARVAQLAVRVAEAGNPNLRGDAVTGAVLAAASARSAASLVDINVGWAGWIPSCHSGPRRPSRTPVTRSSG